MSDDFFLRPNGSIYWASFYVRGVELRESTKQTDPEKASKFLRNRLKEVHADEIAGVGIATAAAKKTTVGNLLNSLKADFELRGKASPQNRSTINLEKEAFGEVRALAFGPKHVDAYISEKLAENYRPASINRVASVVGQAFALAMREGKFSKIPFMKRLSEADNVRQGFVNREQFETLREAPCGLGGLCDVQVFDRPTHRRVVRLALGQR